MGFAMVASEIERFVADLRSSEVLRSEAENAQVGGSHKTPLERAVAFAALKGYSFTTAEVRNHARARARINGKEFTDRELDTLLDGSCLVFFLTGGTCLSCYSVFSSCLLAVLRS
jgi:hypothetical protein